jgi:hypothetical protein
VAAAARQERDQVLTAVGTAILAEMGQAELQIVAAVAAVVGKTKLAAPAALAS